MELSIQERLKDLREAHRGDFFSDPEQASLGIYLQTAPAKLQEAVRGRKEVAQKDF